MSALDLDRLRELLGPQGVLIGSKETAPYLTDERRLYQGKAAAVLRPSSTPALASAVAYCHSQGIGMVPHGGNTGYCGGATPDESGLEVVIALERMNRIRAIEPLSFVLTAEAGVSLAAVQRAAREAGMLFPLSMGSEGSAQIGGALSTNAGGLAVLRYGTARELVLGLEVVLPDGRIWEGLNALRKDNTGYDLKQLFLGAEGTLGIITAAVLKLFPAPAARATAWLAVDDLGTACRVLARMRQQLGDCLTSFEYVSAESLALVIAQFPAMRAPLDPAPAFVLIEISGASTTDALSTNFQAVLARAIEEGLIRDAVLAQSEDQRLALWRLRESIPLAEKQLGGSVKHDVSVQIDRLPLLEARARHAITTLLPAARLSVYGHVGDGNLHFNILAPLSEDPPTFKASHAERISELVHGEARQLGGSFSAEHGVGKLKKALLEATEGPVAMDLMRHLKRALDPAGLMNPGKVLDQQKPQEK